MTTLRLKAVLLGLACVLVACTPDASPVLSDDVVVNGPPTGATVVLAADAERDLWASWSWQPDIEPLPDAHTRLYVRVFDTNCSQRKEPRVAFGDGEVRLTFVALEAEDLDQRCPTVIETRVVVIDVTGRTVDETTTVTVDLLRRDPYDLDIDVAQ